MARIKNQPQNPGEHTGCRISGRCLLPNGLPDASPLSIMPEKSGLWNGVLYSGLEMTVTVGADGRFELVLPPSSVLGLYWVRSNQAVYQLSVPDRPAATFEECVV